MGCTDSTLRVVEQSFYALFDNEPIHVQRRSTELEFTGSVIPGAPMPVVFQPTDPLRGGTATDVTLVSSDLPETARIQMVHDSTLLEREKQTMIKEIDLENVSIAVTCKTAGQFTIVLRVVYI